MFLTLEKSPYESQGALSRNVYITFTPWEDGYQIRCQRQILINAIQDRKSMFSHFTVVLTRCWPFAFTGFVLGFVTYVFCVAFGE